jgi:TonB-dependent SusC/RagA subfamily outer membrane receptor
MKRILIVILALFFIASKVYCQTISQDHIISELKTYSINHPTEKTYLHFDKPYYAAGDTVYFKAYVTAGERHELSGISGVLHVDLIGTDGKIERSIKLQLANGMGRGDFALADSLPAGNYCIRAYTRWMRNEGNYFEQVIPVGSVHWPKIPESAVKRATADTKPDIQFMPEGGGLAYGIESKIAFKALGTNGLGIGVKGTVVDNLNKVVCAFESRHLGMGYFNLKPEQGKTYRARLTYAGAGRDMIDLPIPVSSGIIMSVNNDSLPTARIRLQANKTYFNQNKGNDYTLLIYSGGIATTVALKLDSASICLDILKRRLHTGVATLTLFSSTNEPICERLLFIQNYDQLSLNISTDKPDYTTRGKVSIHISARNRADSAVVGQFSVAVTSESKVPIDENSETTILSNLLLTSDLTGTIEQPNYYFTGITPEKLKELDLVMLTHGYRHFIWKQVLDNNNQPLAWKPERSLQIRGLAKSLFGKPLPKARVALISFVPESLTNTVADDKGEFLFDTLAFNDSIRFVLQAVNVKGKNKTKLIYNSDQTLPITIAEVTGQTDNIPASYLENNEKQQEELNKMGLGKGRILNEVKIRGIRPDDKYETQSFAGAGHADQVMHAAEIEKIQGPLATSLNGRLHGVSFAGSTPYLTGGLGNGHQMLVIVDGIENADISSLNANDVETVEVLRFANAAIYGMQGGNGVVIITTKKTMQLSPKEIASVGILPITVQGYYNARAFYSPKYVSNSPDSRPDLRSTIYWQADLATDKDGNAAFNYYNADGKGNYRVVVEGIDEKGNIGRQVYRYRVD